MNATITTERGNRATAGGTVRHTRPFSGSQTAKYAVLTISAVMMLFPVLLIASTASRDPAEVRVDPFGLFTSFSFESLQRAWTVGGFSAYFWNSILLSVPSTVLTVVLSTCAGYAFARCSFRGRNALFYLTTLGLLVPFFVMMIPLYFQLLQMGLLDTLVGAILVLTASGAGGLSFGIFLMRSFFMDLPVELEQAGRIDGCSEWEIFRRIMLPLVRSGVAALTVFTFLQNWNNFLVPLLYLPGDEYRTLPSALYLFTSGRTMEVGAVAAGLCITILPVIAVFIIAQRQLIRGFTSGAVKG
ncbi:MAG: carbohydrate ABC transporter permease [Actinomycetota bacterium]|nr:carbohydrate ABC transporter permease [Actinomycetota bacterium]